nr:MAG TPA: Protein FAM3C protein.8A [Bacteriophage sp.]
MNQLLARGQISIVVQEDAYTVTQSVTQYIFAADEAGVVERNVSLTSRVNVTHGNEAVADFRIGNVATPAGFTSVVVDNVQHTITYNVPAGSKSLADDGVLQIPVIVGGQTYTLSFTWSKSKQGVPGIEANLLDWVADWNTNRTQIDATTLITPKLFAGVKNANNTLTGVALGHFPLKTVNAQGTIVTEIIDGIYGFRAGRKTFALDSSGSVILGYGDQSITYNAVTGRIEFGNGVSLNWTNAISQAKTEVTSEAQRKADAALASAKGYADTKKDEAVTEAGKNADSKVGMLSTSLNASITDAKKAGTDARAVADALTSKATSEGWSTKLTYIDVNGIFTGTLTAAQVNAVAINAASIKAGTLSAERIAAGSIHSSKLDAASIQANIINAAYVNGLNCTFIRGKIGGFTIGGDNMTVGSVGAAGATPLQIRSGSTGSGYWYTGAYKPLGLTLTWHQSGNAGHIVFGQVAATGNSVKTGFIGLQMMAWDNTEYFCLSTNYTKSGGKEVYNRIAGWAFDNTRIWKNSVSLGGDGSIYNGEKWRLNNDGSGKIANGAISWNSSGSVTFSSAVALNWNNVANYGKLYARGTGLNHNAARLVNLNGSEVVNSGSRGLTLTVINRSNLSIASSTNYDVYSNDANCNLLASALNALNSDKIVVLTSYDAISINETLNAALQRCGGSNLTINSSRNPYVLIGIPTIGKDNGLVAVYGTGESEPYAEISTVIINGIPQGINVTGKQKTYIDGNGVYTGTVRAGQVLIDSTLIVGGSSYNGSVSVRDAGNNVKVTLDRSGIMAIGGTIGGFTLNDHALYSINVTAGHTIGIQNNGYMYNCNSSTNADYWALNTDGSAMFGSGRIKFNADGSGYIANQNIKWDISGNVTLNGTITATGGKIAGFTISGNKLINTASDSSIEFSSMIGNASLYINSSGSLISMRADSSRTGISIQTYATGARGMYILANAGSSYAVEAYGPMQFGQRSGERWCMPGVLYIGSKYSTGYNNYYRKIWGDGVTISSFSHIGDGKYRVYHNLRHTDYTVMAILWSSTTYYGFFRLLERTSTYFVIQNIGASGKADAGAFDFVIMGRNVW